MTRAKKPSVRLHGPFHDQEPRASAQHFSECQAAQEQYEAHRSELAPADTRTFHLLVDEEVVGFISWRVAQKDHSDGREVFASIEYIYIKEPFRALRLSKVLVESIVREVQARVIRAFYFAKFKSVDVHSTSGPISRAGDRVLYAFECALTGIARRQPGTRMIGRHSEHPAGARSRLWATMKPSRRSGSSP